MAAPSRPAKILSHCFHQPPRSRTQIAAAAGDRDDVLACREISHADGRDGLVPQLFRRIALRQQRDAETGFDQAFLRGQAVDRRPVDFAEAIGLEQREDMRGGDLASSGHYWKGNPPFATQLGKFCDPASGAGVIQRAHHPQPFGKQQFAIEIG